jgi:hypothetical protein
MVGCVRNVISSSKVDSIYRLRKTNLDQSIAQTVSSCHGTVPHLVVDPVFVHDSSFAADAPSKRPEACFAGCLQQCPGHGPRGIGKTALRATGNAALGSDAAQCRLGSFRQPGANRLGSDLHLFRRQHACARLLGQVCALSCRNPPRMGLGEPLPARESGKLISLL